MGVPLPGGAVKVEAVEKGWSREQKYKVFGLPLGDALLRLRPEGDFLTHRREYDFVRALYARGCPVPKPLAFGPLPDDGGSYMLLSWVEGEDLQTALPALPPQRQTALGLEAGQVLNRIHRTPLPALPLPRNQGERALSKLRRFEKLNLSLEGAPQVAAFIETHLYWLDAGPSVCLHGDFHPGNLILMPTKNLGVIDFNRWDVGEIAEEFAKLQSFTIETSPLFAKGQLDGYFASAPTPAFWQSLAVYNAITALYSIYWAQPYGPNEVAAMVARYHRAFADYRGFTQIIPAWYT